MRKSVVSGLAGAVVLAGLLAFPAPHAHAQSVVRIGMTAADIPRTLGQPDQGFEGNRFTGNTMYEGLTHVGPLLGRQGERHHSRVLRPNGRSIAERQDQVDLQAAARREIP